jgi:hypothetical protein
MSETTDPAVQAAPSINILPAETHGDILVQLIRGQERSATQILNLTQRLFGVDGQPGALPFLIEQHKEVSKKMEDNKTELLNRIDAAKEDLSTKMGAQQVATDAKFTKVDEKHAELDKRVTWYSGGIALLGTIATLAIGLMAIFHHTSAAVPH